MFTISLKSVLARKLRLALTMTAVMLGVTFITGALVLTDTSDRLFDEQFADRADGADLVARTTATFDHGMGVEVQRDPVAPGIVDRIRSVDSVGRVSPSVQGQALIVVDGAPVIPEGRSVGASWESEPFGAFTLRWGREPRIDGEVVIDAATAVAAGVAVGDRIGVQTDGPVEPFTVVGVAGFGDADGIPNATVALFDLGSAQRLLGLGDAYTQVGITATDGVALEALRGRIAVALGEGYEVVTAQDIAAAGAAAAKAQVGMLPMLLAIIAATALLVGAFLIGNTFTVLVAQRTRELATLRAVGASGRQVLGSILAEAGVVGIVSSLAGTALGVVTATLLRRLVAAFGTDLPAGGLVVTPRTVLVGVAVGTIVTVVSAAGSARKAARVAPIEAMRGAAAPLHTAGRGRLWSGSAAGLAATGALTAIFAGALSGPSALALVGVLAVAAITLLGPAAAGPIVRTIGGLFAGRGITGRLARDSAARAPRRTAATVTALAVGLAVVTFMTTLAASVKQSIATGHDEAIRSEYIIESARGEMLGGLSPHVAHRVGELPEVAVAARMQFGHWQDGTATEPLSAIDPTALTEVADLDMVDGNLEALSRGGVVLSEAVASARGVWTGDELEMAFARTGVQRLKVVGILASADQWALRTGYVISLDTYADHFTEDVDAAVFVKLADDVDPTQARTAIEQVLEAFPTAALRDNAEAIASRTRAIDQILGLVTVLLILAVVIALLGITNTLALSVVERTRELGLLRAVGMSRRQIRALVRREALLIAAAGATVGITLGLLLTGAGLRALSGQAAIPLAIPTAQLVGYLAAVAVAGLAAGMLPARRAARLDVLKAIAVE